MSNIIKIGNSTIIMNGGDPLPGCPENWEDAKKWEEKANEDKGDSPQWSFDCGFKLDYDGDLVRVSSRFYPPTTHGGSTWDGNVTIMIGGNDFREKSFDCPTLEELKIQVEKYVTETIFRITDLLKHL